MRRGNQRSQGPQRDQKIHKLYQHKHLSVAIWVEDVPVDKKVEDYEIAELTALRDRLNETKSKMDKFYIGSKTDESLASRWMSLQTAVDIYRPMRRYIQEKFNGQSVTNAWMKYYEIYSQFNLIPEDSKMFSAFFNAELPGAAVCAFNHYMKTMRPATQFDWRASSLAPDQATTNNTTALGDNYGLFEKNRSNWMMHLKDEELPEGSYRNNGDVTILANLRDLASKLGPKSPRGGVNLYSHDAGIDVSGSEGELNFNQQELMNAKIHLGCALAGFMTLKPGGVFIAKQYTFFETFTWNLILIYATLFEDFYISKPLTSRPYNSEIYLVGRGFKGMPEKIEKLLCDRLENFNTSPFIPKDGFKVLLTQPFADLQRFSRIIYSQQIQFIEENLELFDRYGQNIRALNRGLEWVRIERRDAWLRTYPMKPIQKDDWLPMREKQRDGGQETEQPEDVKNESDPQDNDSQQISYEGLV